MTMSHRIWPTGFAAAYRARGGELEIHKFDAQPHTFIVRDPASDASRRATELIRDFVLKRAPRLSSAER